MGQVCIDELEVYGPELQKNWALASGGAVASASSCLPGYEIHQIAHLNDGRYGNVHSWIAATTGQEWAQVELPRPVRVDRVVISRDREGKYHDRLPVLWQVAVLLGRTELEGGGRGGNGTCRYGRPGRSTEARFSFLTIPRGNSWWNMLFGASGTRGERSPRRTICRRCGATGRQFPAGRFIGASFAGWRPSSERCS